MVVPWVLVEWLVQDQEGLADLALGVQEDPYPALGDLVDLVTWALMVQWESDQDLQVLDHLQVQDRE